jgi:hypothetical protein
MRLGQAKCLGLSVSALLGAGFVIVSGSSQALLAQSNKVLKGNVKEQGVKAPTKSSSYSLSRDEINDPFTGPGSKARAKSPVKIPNPKDPFSVAPPTIKVEESPELKLAWDDWHNRLAKIIYQRYEDLAAMAYSNSKPLLAKVTYVVTKDGQVGAIQVVDKSADPMFDNLICQVIMSLDGDRVLLAFPKGSTRQAVEKSATFTQNYGKEGFRYTTGDEEKVKGK